jgi:hypothetical protein
MNGKELLRVRPIDSRLPPVQNHFLPQQLARKLPESVHVDGLLNDAIPESHFRSRLDKVGRSGMAQRARGTSPAAGWTAVEKQQTNHKHWS